MFEEIDIDRISEFVTMTSDGHENQMMANELNQNNAASHNQDLSIEPDSTIARMINMAAS